MRNVLILTAITDLLQNEFGIVVPDDSEILAVAEAGLGKPYLKPGTDEVDEELLKKDLLNLQNDYLLRAKADLGL